MIIPLFFQANLLAKKLTINNVNTKLSQGIDDFESQIFQSNEIAKLMREDDLFQEFLLLEGNPDASAYLNLKNLQKNLSLWSLTVDMVNDSYIMYKNNPLFISNHFAIDTYLDAYSKFFEYGDLKVEQWRNLMFNDVKNLTLLKEVTIQSQYNSPIQYQGIPLLINNSFQNISPSCIWVFIFNKQEIVDNILDSTEQEICSLTLKDHTGNTIFSINDQHNLDNSVSVSYTSSQQGLYAEIKIPQSYLNNMVRSLTNLLIIYLLAGISVLFCIFIFLIIWDSKKAKMLIEKAVQHSGLTYNSANEYNFVANAMDTLQKTNEERGEQLTTLKSSFRSAMLENILLFGSITPNRYSEENQDFLEKTFKKYAIIAVEFTGENTQETFLQIDYFLASLHKDAIRLIMDTNQVVCIMPIEDMSLSEHLLDILQKYADQNQQIKGVTLQLGISDVFQNIEHAHEAYQQAKTAIHLNAVPGQCGAFPYCRPVMGKKIFEPTLQMQLHDALITGNIELIQHIFGSLRTSKAIFSVAKEQKEMVFYAICHTIHNAFLELSSGKDLNDISLDFTSLSFDGKKELPDMLAILEKFCLNLCEGRKSKKSRHTQTLLEFIQQFYTDPNLSAGMIGEKLSISPNTVYSIIRDETGKSLSTYIEELRLKKAENLLLNTELPISQIWEKCGFGSEKTFYRIFSKIHGVSPKTWKNNNKN